MSALGEDGGGGGAWKRVYGTIPARWEVHMRRLGWFPLVLILAMAPSLIACGGKSTSDVDITVVRRPGLNMGYLSLNNNVAPFDDARVRQAVAFAINKERIVKLAYRGEAKPAPVPVPPTIEGHHDGIVDRTLNIEKAKALLAEAGITGDKLKVTLSHSLNSRPYMPRPEDVAKQVAGDLEAVGFDVEIRVEEWNPYLTMLREGRHQMGLIGWSADAPDADTFLWALLGTGSEHNNSFYANDEVHQLLVKARAITDQVERARLYRKAQEIIFDEVPIVPLVYTERSLAHNAAFGPIMIEQVTHPVLRRIERPKDGELIYLRGNDSKHLDPGDVTDGESSKVVEQIYDQLVRYKPGSADVEPSLATGWSNSDDRKTWTFQIREGVTFHDGTSLDGAAVVNAFERQRDPEHPHHFDDANFSYWVSLFKFVDRVALGAGPMEVVFHCNTPAPPFFLQLLGAFNTSIPSPAALDKFGKDFRRNPVGTGPFRFVSHKTDVEIVLERNDAYWDGAPALKRVIFMVSKEPAVRVQRLRAGQQCDLTDNLDPKSLQQLEAE